MPALRPRVITSADASTSLILGDKRTEDPYVTKIINYIPAEVIAAYECGAGIIAGVEQASATLGFTWAALLLVASPLWIAFATKDPGQPIAWFQASITPVAFAVWVFALGGPFTEFSWYRPEYGSLMLILTTLIIPILEGTLVKSPAHA